MLVITRISPQVKRDGYYNIYINEKYELSLSELDLANFQLKTNQTLDEKKLEELKRAQSRSKSYNFAIRYLALRPRSVKEVYDYLVVRKGFSAEDAKLSVDKLIEEKYLDDQDFSEMWVRNRTLLSPKSNKVLRLELLKKGIDRSVIDSVLSSIDKDQQIEILKSLIEKKIRQTKYQDKQKLTEYLSRQGFTYNLIKQAMESLTFFED